MKGVKRRVYQIIIVVLTFWILDFILHYAGVGETNYYYLSKLGNAILFSIIWFFAFNSKEHWKKLVFSFVFGTWVSFYYLISSYSGFVQYLGVVARYTPPPFVIFGLYLSPLLWWVYHSIVFYLGLELSRIIQKK